MANDDRENNIKIVDLVDTFMSTNKVICRKSIENYWGVLHVFFIYFIKRKQIGI